MLTEEEYFRLMEQAGLMTKGDEVIRIATNEGIETFSPPVFAAYCSSDGRNFLTRLAHYKRLVGPYPHPAQRTANGHQRTRCPPCADLPQLQIRPCQPLLDGTARQHLCPCTGQVMAVAYPSHWRTGTTERAADIQQMVVKSLNADTH